MTSCLPAILLVFSIVANFSSVSFRLIKMCAVTSVGIYSLISWIPRQLFPSGAAPTSIRHAVASADCGATATLNPSASCAHVLSSPLARQTPSTLPIRCLLFGSFLSAPRSQSSSQHMSARCSGRSAAGVYSMGSLDVVTASHSNSKSQTPTKSRRAGLQGGRFNSDWVPSLRSIQM